jgi:hypothetical protein
MGYGCCGTGFQKARSFLTKEERIVLLKEYKNDLEKETEGLSKGSRNSKQNKLLLIFFI